VKYKGIVNEMSKEIDLNSEKGNIIVDFSK